MKVRLLEEGISPEVVILWDTGAATLEEALELYPPGKAVVVEMTLEEKVVRSWCLDLQNLVKMAAVKVDTFYDMLAHNVIGVTQMIKTPYNPIHMKDDTRAERLVPTDKIKTIDDFINILTPRFGPSVVETYIRSWTPTPPKKDDDDDEGYTTGGEEDTESQILVGDSLLVIPDDPRNFRDEFLEENYTAEQRALYRRQREAVRQLTQPTSIEYEIPPLWIMNAASDYMLQQLCNPVGWAAMVQAAAFIKTQKTCESYTVLMLVQADDVVRAFYARYCGAYSRVHGQNINESMSMTTGRSATYKNVAVSDLHWRHEENLIMEWFRTKTDLRSSPALVAFDQNMVKFAKYKSATESLADGQPGPWTKFVAGKENELLPTDAPIKWWNLMQKVRADFPKYQIWYNPNKRNVQ